MDDLSPGGGRRLLDVAITVLLASMALYGAVLILQAIWVWLCIGLAVIACVAGLALLLRRSGSPW